MGYLKDMFVKDLKMLSGKMEEKSNECLRKSKDISDCWYGKAMGLQAGCKELEELIEKYEAMR